MKAESRMTLYLLLALTLTAGTVTRAWNVSVNGRPTSDFDEGMAVAVDPQTGSVFVAGERQTSERESSFIVVKYSRTGVKEWQHAVPGASFLATGRAAVAVDADGFVSAVGTIFGSEGSGDLVLVKLDGRTPKKRVFWTRTFDAFGSADAVNAMALTPDGGLAVAAQASGTGLPDGYVMRFNAAGQDAWPAAQILTGTAVQGLDAATAISILPGGDVAVVGTIANTGTNHDAIVARLDGATGARRWIRTINDPLFNGDDFGRAISIAANGDIVGGGMVATRAGSQDFAVFRFDGAGNLRWQRIIDRGFSHDQARAIAVTADDDVIAAGALGTRTGPNNSIFYVVKLRGTDGVPEWQYEDAGPSDFLEGRSIAFDSAGNPVVTGMGPAADALSAFTMVALSRADGSVIWNLPITGTTPLVNHGNAVAFNPATSAVIAVGVTQNRRTSFDLTVVQISGGQEDWRQVINGRGKRVDRDDGAVAIAADPRRRGVAVAGYAQNTGTGLLGTVHDFRLVKIGAGGDVDWTYDFNDPLPHSRNEALAVAVSERGHVFGAGRTCHLGITSCFTVVRVGRSGKETWRTIVRGDTAGRDEARAIVVDPNDGNVIVAGNVQLAGSRWAVVKLDAATGDVLWSAPMPGFGFTGSAKGLALTARGTVAVAAVTASGGGVVDVDTSTGELLSSRLSPGIAAEHVALDARDGTVVVAGTLMQDVVTRVITVAKFDDGGNVVWSTRFGNVLAPNTRLEGLALLPNGAVAIAGGGALIRLDADGSEAWRRSSGTARGVAFTSDRVIVVGQLLEGTRMVFGVLAFDADGVEAWRRTFPGTATFGLDSASAVMVNDDQAAIFAAGIITNSPTGPDISVAGLAFDGTDIPASLHSSDEHTSP